jgi:hypothetical protein
VDGNGFLDAVFANGTPGGGQANRVCLNFVGKFSCSNVSIHTRFSIGVALGEID